MQRAPCDLARNHATRNVRNAARKMQRAAYIMQHETHRMLRVAQS
jgi:hypothetical protein